MRRSVYVNIAIVSICADSIAQRARNAACLIVFSRIAFMRRRFFSRTDQFSQIRIRGPDIFVEERRNEYLYEIDRSAISVHGYAHVRVA